MSLSLVCVALGLYGLLGVPPWAASTISVAASMGLGLFGIVRLVRREQRGRFGFVFAGIAFSAAAFSASAILTLHIVGVFAAGGVVWGLTRVVPGRLPRIVAALFTVFAGAWGVGTLSGDGAAFGWLRWVVLGLAEAGVLMATLRAGATD